MASDTATLDVERVQQERRRLEGRDRGRPAPLGPQDRAPAGGGRIDTDPATRAREIVAEVLAAARKDGIAVEATPVPESMDTVAAATARRIVEDVLTAAEEARELGPDGVTPEAGPDGDGVRPLRDWVRADLVLLTAERPLVLLPGEAYEPDDGPYLPHGLGRAAALVDQALGPLTGPRVAEARNKVGETGSMVADQLRAAGESSVPGVRWAVVAAVWALAFALVVPFALRGLLASVDLTVDLFSPEDIETEQQPDSPEAEELLETTD